MKHQEKTLGETDPQGCLEAEARRNHCAHPPVAELYQIWCSDCNTESTADGKVILSHDEPIKIPLNELDTANIDFIRLAHLDEERKKNQRN